MEKSGIEDDKDFDPELPQEVVDRAKEGLARYKPSKVKSTTSSNERLRANVRIPVSISAAEKDKWKAQQKKTPTQKKKFRFMLERGEIQLAEEGTEHMLDLHPPKVPASLSTPSAKRQGPLNRKLLKKKTPRSNVQVRKSKKSNTGAKKR